MKIPPKITIADHFADLSDPRVERTKYHLLTDIITIAICGVICGADAASAIETYGKAKQQWLQKFLDLSNGMPSHEPNARVFARIDPQEFQSGFLNWIKSISKITPMRSHCN